MPIRTGIFRRGRPGALNRAFVHAFALLVCASACTAAPEPTASAAVGALAQPKQLATVFATATPDEAAMAATDIAAGAATAAARATAAVVFAATPRAATATPYVGVFIGASADDGPVIDPARYEGTRAAAQPTATVSPCPIAPEAVYGTAWAEVPAVARALGCPGEPGTPYPGAAAQVFENGVMYSLPTGEIWAIAPGAADGTAWYFPVPPPDLPLEIAVPQGLRTPTGTFGRVWRAYADIREALGYARADEAAADLGLQRFSGGALLYDESSAQVFAIPRQTAATPGSVYGPFNTETRPPDG
jgi:hypothetical protein